MDIVSLSFLGSILYYVFSFGIAAKMSNVSVRNNISKIILISFLPLFMATFRYNIGYDYTSYMVGFQNYQQVSFGTIFHDFSSASSIAFTTLAKWASTFGSERIYLLILAVCSLIPGLLYILEDWNDNENKSLVLFAYLFGPFIFSFSACRQGIALSILILSLAFVYRRKPIGFFFCVFIAILFHPTAVAFAPVYFFINREGNMRLWKKVLIIAAVLLVIFNLQTVLGLFFSGQYKDYAIAEVYGRNRTFWLYSAMTLLFIIFRNRLVELDERNELLIMLMVVGALCQVLGFSNAFAKRIGEYFTFSQLFLLPQMASVVNYNSRKVVNVFIVIYLVSIFVLMNPIASSGMGFIPFNFKFS